MSDNMILPGSLGPIQPGRPEHVSPSVKPDGSFKDILFESIEKVDRLQHEAETAMNRLRTGQADRVAEVIVATQKAELAFQTLMQIRNRVVAAYQEMNQMRF